jgi:hypothetical protein
VNAGGASLMRVLVIVVGVLLAFWLIGAVLNVVGSVIHLLLIVALIVVVYAVTRRAR